MSAPDAAVFKALAAPTRRLMLDRLNASNGQTLTELCQDLEMARQSATQHIAVLEAANLISVVWRGREKLHYLNPVPLHEIQERWIDRFEVPRLRALSAVKRKAEERHVADPPNFVYVVYIESTAQAVWDALTDREQSALWWGHQNVSDWQVGSRWEHQRTDGTHVPDVEGEVVESSPPTRLVVTAGQPGESRPEGPSRVIFEIEPYGDIVRLTVIEENFRDEPEREEAAAGWSAVLSNLKSFLETGSPLPQEPWLMPRY